MKNVENRSKKKNELTELARYSAVLGRDPLLTQGPGGNTSIKIGDVLHVKGSGMWLADAATQQIFSRVPLPELRRAIASDESGELVDRVVSASAGNGPRPSIETSLHALMPHRIVVHIHPVDVLGWVVLKNARTKLAPFMEGLAWSYTGYRRPGTPLTLAVREEVRSKPDVILLANHGPVVGGETVEEAKQRVDDLLTRLRLDSRPGSVPHDIPLPKDTVDAAAAKGYRPARHSAAHGVATDPVSCQLAQRGVFYPDQAIFLGPKIPAITDMDQMDGLLADWRRRYGGRPTCVIVRDQGVFLQENAGRAADEQLLGHALFLARVAADAELETLSVEDVGQLLNWEAEIYRQNLSARN